MSQVNGAHDSMGYSEVMAALGRIVVCPVYMVKHGAPPNASQDRDEKIALKKLEVTKSAKFPFLFSHWHPPYSMIKGIFE